MSDNDFQELVEKALAGRFDKEGDYYRIPTLLFVGKVDIKMPPLPMISLYEKLEGKDIIKFRDSKEPYSALALSKKEIVFVHQDEIEAIQRFAEAQILSSARASNLPVEERVTSLRRAAILVVEDLFDSPSTENINRSQKVVGSFVNLLMKEPKAYLALTRLSSHDPYTLQHSVGTAVNSIILARKLGVKDEDELHEIGMAGLLHDIGKVKVSKEIINKQGPLNDEEWEEMRGHSEFGYDIVKDHPNLSDRTKLAVLEHHEDKKGTGYPNGKGWDDLHEYSKIVCIADIFNALTTDRSYSNARSPFEALQLMKDKMTHKIDESMFGQMVRIYGGQIDDLEEAA